MNSEELHYLRIDHKNSLEVLSNEEQSKLTLSLYTTIASVEEDTIGNELNKYFGILIEKNDSDLLEINYSQTDLYQKTFKISLDEIEMGYFVNDVLATEYGTTFEFNQNNTENIMRILCYSFISLRKEAKELKITTHSEMLDKIEKVMSSMVDAIKIYFNNDNVFSQSDSRMSSFSSNGEYMKQMPSSTMSTQSGISDKFKGGKNYFTYPYSNRKGKKIDPLKYGLPIEMIILLNKFQCVKKFVFSIDNIDKKEMMEVLSILLNHQWLFPNMLEVEFDLSNEYVQKELNGIFNRRMSKKCKKMPKKTTMYDTNANSGFKWTPNNDKDESSPELLRSSTFNRDYDTKSVASSAMNERSKCISNLSRNAYIDQKKEFFEIIIIYSFFISQMRKLKSLSLKFHDSYSYEIKKTLSALNINLVDFHFITFIKELKEITEMGLVFNGLDTQSFQKILGMIHKNNHLLNLRLNLFNSDNNYTPASLYKLCSGLKINIKEIFSDKFFSFGEKGFENDEIDHWIINKLLSCFEDNLEKLFHVLLNNFKIQELTFFLDLPKIIGNNDSYLMVLIKFVFNLFFMLSREMHKYKVFKIIAPELQFNCRKNPFIDNYLEEIDLERDNMQLKNLTVQLGCYSLSNIGNFLFTKLESLFLGDLDIESFDSFVEVYSNPEFLQKSQLNTITISLNNTILKYSMVEKSLTDLFEKKPKKLYEQNLISNIKLDQQEEANELVDLIYRRNKAEVNSIEINEGGLLLCDAYNALKNIPLSILYVFIHLNKKPKNIKRIIASISRCLYIPKPFSFKSKY